MSTEIIGGNDLIAAISNGVFELDAVVGDESLRTNAAILAAYIITQLALMTFPSEEGVWPLFVGYLPDILKDAGATYDTNGVLDGRIQKTGELIEHSGVQLRICSSDYEKGFNKINAIAEELNGLHNETIIIGDDVFQIQNLLQATPATYIGLNEKRRFNFTVDYLVDIITI